MSDNDKPDPANPDDPRNFAVVPDKADPGVDEPLDTILACLSPAQNWPICA